MDAMRRGNYDSGQDYVLEYGELRFTFNERDFSERVEQSARRLGFVHGRLHLLLRHHFELRHVSRVESASPASGIAALHHMEQEDLLQRTFAGL